MHMADALLSPAVGMVMNAASVGAVAYSVAKVKKDELSEKKIPIIGVAGAMVFAGQMINFTIPATGSSGHIGGGIMLAGLLGGGPAFLAITAVLIIQCLCFADGGLLALGCNIFNIGVIPCLIIYPLLFKPLLGKGLSYKRLTAASVVSVIAGLELGALAVVVQTTLSGISALPFAAFASLMLPIHLVIGLVEGIVTAAILCFVYRMRPEILESARSGEDLGKTPVKKPLIAFAVITIIAGGALSVFASSNPDGLEWALERTAGTAELEASGGIYDDAEAAQESLSFLPDYNFAEGEDSNPAGTSLSGVIGAAITCVLAGGTGFVISKVKKRSKAGTES